jgi:hypothetical protein
MFKPFATIPSDDGFFRFSGTRGLLVASVEDSLKRSFQRSTTAVAIGAGDWHRGSSLGVCAASREFELGTMLPLFSRLANAQYEVSMIVAEKDAVDDMVIDTHSGRVVLRVVRGTPFFVWAYVLGATACVEAARTDLRALALEFGGVVPRLRSAFDS